VSRNKRSKTSTGTCPSASGSVCSQYTNSDRTRPSRNNVRTSSTEMKRGFGQHRFTCHSRFGDPFGNPDRPLIMVAFQVSERNEKTRVRGRLHLREKPLRIERPLGPAIAPAERRNGRLADVLRAVVTSRFAESFGRRTRIALLICLNCSATANRRAPAFPASSPRRPLAGRCRGRRSTARREYR
jgi:hypothetical protein